MIAVLYARASIDHPDTAQQHAELQEVAYDLGFNLTELVTETDSKRRPALARLLREARSGSIAAILVTRFSRLVPGGVRQLGEVLVQLGEVRLIAVDEHFDSHTRRGRIGAQHLIALARFDHEVASETTRTAQAWARAKGVHLGRPRKTTLRSTP